MSATIATRRACLRYVSTLSKGAAWLVAAELYNEPSLPDEVAAHLRELERHVVEHRAAVFNGDDEDKRNARMRVLFTLRAVAGAAARWCVTREEVVTGELREVSP